MKVAVLANLKEDAPVSPDDPPGRWDDLDERLTIDTILESMNEIGYEARYFPAELKSISKIIEFNPDIVFNSSEGHYGESREAQMPAVLDILRIPYTCAGVLGMSLSHNKHIAKQMFSYAGLPTAKFFVMSSMSDLDGHGLRFPLFVKPASEGSSIGINEKAVVKDHQELIRQAGMILDTVHSKVLVEEYIEGREFTIGILGNEVLPIVEIISPTGFYDREQKEDLESEVYRICPADLPEEKTREFQQIALKAKQILNLEDVCRMDLRMDKDGNPYILEVNPIPLMHPDPEQASLVYASRAAGYTYTDIVRKIVESALSRLDSVAI
ncbi:MAG: ATP-grasp domain-containing protein [Anaerolineaceae bacterium]|jgi:D-alanine-D-alanine ligase